MLNQRACDGAVAKGCYSLAYMYQRGLGVTQDEVKASALIQKACDGEVGEACTEIGEALRAAVRIHRAPRMRARTRPKRSPSIGRVAKTQATIQPDVTSSASSLPMRSNFHDSLPRRGRDLVQVAETAVTTNWDASLARPHGSRSTSPERLPP